MKAFLEYLEGKKTYAVCGLAFLLCFGSWQHWWVIPADVYGLLAAAALAALRAGVAKSGDQN